MKALIEKIAKVSNTLTFKKESFIQRFLTPISKLADNVSLFIDDKKMYAVCSSQDGGIVLLATLETESQLKGITRINIPDIKKLVRLLDCIEEQEINLTVENNHLKYFTSDFKFNYYLLEDSYMQRCPVNPDKIRQLTYDSEFTLTNAKFNDILKGSSIATDTDKLYFFTKDNSVFAELNDYERQNINNITYLISDNFFGNPIKNALPLNLEHVRMLAGLRVEDLKIKINSTLKVTLFEASDENVNIKFIISALVK